MLGGGPIGRRGVHHDPGQRAAAVRSRCVHRLPRPAQHGDGERECGIQRNAQTHRLPSGQFGLAFFLFFASN